MEGVVNQVTGKKLRKVRARHVEKADGLLMELADRIIEEDLKFETGDYIEDMTELSYHYINRIKNHYDVVQAVSGYEGEGKSTFSKIEGAVCSRLQDLPFSIADNVLYAPTSEEVTQKILFELPRGAYIDGDEAVRMLYKLKWWEPMQIYINQIYKVCRKYGKISNFNMPCFWDFNTGFRNTRIFIWVHIITRGRAIVLGKENAPFVEDPWHFKENQKSWQKLTRGKKVLDISFDDKLTHLQKSKNYMGEIPFPKLPGYTMKVYEMIADEYKSEFQADSGTPTLKRYKGIIGQLLRFVYDESDMSCREMSEQFALDQKTIARWVRDAGGDVKMGRPVTVK